MNALNIIFSTLAVVAIILNILRAKGKLKEEALESITAGTMFLCFVIQFITIFMLQNFYGYTGIYYLQPASALLVLSAFVYIFGAKFWLEKEEKEQKDVRK